MSPPALPDLRKNSQLASSVSSLPKEECDLNPQHTCRTSTKLVPRVEPMPRCPPCPGKPATSRESEIGTLENEIEQPEETPEKNSDSLAGGTNLESDSEDLESYR